MLLNYFVFVSSAQQRSYIKLLLIIWLLGGKESRIRRSFIFHFFLFIYNLLRIPERHRNGPRRKNPDKRRGHSYKVVGVFETARSADSITWIQMGKLCMYAAKWAGSPRVASWLANYPCERIILIFLYLTPRTGAVKYK